MRQHYPNSPSTSPQYVSQHLRQSSLRLDHTPARTQRFVSPSNQDGIVVNITSTLCRLHLPTPLPSLSTTRFNLRRISISDRRRTSFVGPLSHLPVSFATATAISTPCFLQLASVQCDYIIANRSQRLLYSSLPLSGVEISLNSSASGNSHVEQSSQTYLLEHPKASRKPHGSLNARLPCC